MNRKSVAFTLVELLVVIAIIGLLIAVALPAFRHAKWAAKKTASNARLTTLDTALQMFRSEQALGNDFPPSRPDNPNLEIHPLWWVNDPNDPSQIKPTGNQPRPTSGAAMLYLALSGHDGAGMRPFKSQGSQGWALSEPPINSARYGPFVGDVDFSADLDNAQHAYVDLFGNPILYYRVRKVASKPPSGQGFRLITDPAPNPPLIGQVDYRDNALLTPEWATLHDGDAGFALPVEDKTPGRFDQIITNSMSIRGSQSSNGTWVKVDSAASHKPGEYLLITAGQDKTYGTRDDVANFTINNLR